MTSHPSPKPNPFHTCRFGTAVIAGVGRGVVLPGVVLSLTEFSASPWLCLLLIGLAAIHFLVARFGSHRVAPKLQRVLSLAMPMPNLAVNADLSRRPFARDGSAGNPTR